MALTVFTSHPYLVILGYTVLTDKTVVFLFRVAGKLVVWGAMKVYRRYWNSPKVEDE